jgi:uncharacterized protein DUF5674
LTIIKEPISREELLKSSEDEYGDIIKAVVDVEQEIIALGGELHADGESLLLDNGSIQSNLWGINIHLANPPEETVEFDSMINIRPRQGNRSRSVENKEIREKIIEIVKKLIQ